MGRSHHRLLSFVGLCVFVTNKSFETLQGGHRALRRLQHLSVISLLHSHQQQPRRRSERANALRAPPFVSLRTERLLHACRTHGQKVDAVRKHVLRRPFVDRRYLRKPLSQRSRRHLAQRSLLGLLGNLRATSPPRVLAPSAAPAGSSGWVRCVDGGEIGLDSPRSPTRSSLSLVPTTSTAYRSEGTSFGFAASG